MMNNPPVNELQDKVGTRYMLVTVVAKRARQIIAEENADGKEKELKPVSYAVNELYKDKLDMVFPEEYKI